MLTLPRAASTNPNDPRYGAWIECPLQISVWLDGVEQRLVDTYDMDENFIVRAVPTDEGGSQLDATGQDILRERVEGVVEVAWVSCSR